jgi:hypothetical protein
MCQQQISMAFDGQDDTRPDHGFFHVKPTFVFADSSWSLLYLINSEMAV